MRGFGNPTRRRHVKDYIREEGLDTVGLQETIREDFSKKELDDLAGDHFRWIWRGSIRHFGGILMGIKEDRYEMEDYEIGDHYVSVMLRDRLTNLRWELITVYGTANPESSKDFIAELSRKCLCPSLPLVFGGDFNLIRHAKEKNNENINQNLMDRFNMFIDLHQLQEIRRSGPKYTWTNKRTNPVMVMLDRILVSTEWELKHPLCFAWSKTRVGSDHWPIFLDLWVNSEKDKKPFYFEK
jgi:exonuclease III